MKFILGAAFFVIATHILQAQNVGIGTSDPKATLDIHGDLILESKELIIPDGTIYQLDVNSDKYNQYKLTGPTSNFQIAGITAAAHDRTVALYNRSGVSLEVYNDDTNTLPEDRILTGTGGTYAVYNGGNVVLKYDTLIAKWEVISGHYTNLDYFGSTDVWTASANDVYNTNSGNVGIGTTTPLEKLAVVGNVDISGDIKMSGVGGLAGDILQNNGNGTMTWAPMTQNENGSVGYGTWGCSMDNLSEYNPIMTGEQNISCFGYAMNLQGSWAVLGAPCTEINLNSNQGTAFVYHLVGSNWILQQQLIASDGLAEDIYGVSVAIENDWLIISASNATVNGIPNRGAVYIYQYTGTEWIQTQKLYNPAGNGLSNFGQSVSFNGITIAIGNPQYNNGTGEVDVYTYNGSIWVLQSQIAPAAGLPNDHFGSSVSIDNDWMVVGAPDDEYGAINASGSVYFFHYDGNSWMQQQKFYFAFPNVNNSRFGTTVSISGNNAIVGSGTNKLEFFKNVNSTWQRNRNLLMSASMVSISGDFAMINGSKIFRATPESWLLYETVIDPEGAFGSNTFNAGTIGSNRFVISSNVGSVGPGLAIFGKIKD